MTTYKVAHQVERLITHRVEATSPEEANQIAVEHTLVRVNELRNQHAELDFGAIDDRARQPESCCPRPVMQPSSCLPVNRILDASCV